MKKFLLLLTLMPLIFTTSGCSSLDHLKAEVQRLTQKVRNLSTDEEVLVHQKALNSKGDNQLYLLKRAQAPAENYTGIGPLRVEISQIAAASDGTDITLNMEMANASVLPSFTGTLFWGKIDEKVAEPIMDNNTSSQSISYAASSIATSGSLTVHLSGTAPDDLGFILLNDLKPNN